MILFVTDYDEATMSNRLIAETLVDNVETALLGAAATRQALHNRLGADAQPLYAMSHGKPEHIRAQDNESAITVADIPLVSQRATFAFACHTATVLGREVADAGGAWWGYTGPICAPPDDQRQQVILRSIFELLMSFRDHESREGVQQFLVTLKDSCLAAAQQIGPDGNVMDAHYCILHLWHRLRVWLPHALDAIHHPEATDGFIFE